MTTSVEVRPVVGYDGIREAATTMARAEANPVIARRMDSLRAGTAATGRPRATTSIGTP